MLAVNVIQNMVRWLATLFMVTVENMLDGKATRKVSDKINVAKKSHS